MKIIISPAKKMNEDTDSLEWRSLPEFLSKTDELLAVLKELSYDELKKLWKCNDKIAQLNVSRFHNMDLRTNLTPAILAYEGIQYQYMAPGVFTNEEFDYIQEHLHILSGFYGILRPFDGVRAYRLEMQAKLRVSEHKDLYSFWGSSLAEQLTDKATCIINLASKEYSSAVYPHIHENTRFLTCVFGEETNGKIIEKGTMCKMARGEMLRFMAEEKVETPDELKKFSRLNYRFSSENSSKDNYVFLKR